MDCKLKPCPFCGEKVKIMHVADDYIGWCRKCRSMGPVGKTEEEAARLWNRRACDADEED